MYLDVTRRIKVAWAENIICSSTKGKHMPQQDVLEGKVGLVTGGSRGIGFAVARRLGKMGARVAICGRDLAALEGAASNLRGEGIRVLAVPADVSRADQVSHLVHTTQQELGPVDILVNNAGTGAFGPFHQF
jgi:3-oxoacyl-[acyl-carrier protein] reductase